MKKVIAIVLGAALFAGAFSFHGAFLLDGPVMPNSSASAGMAGLRVLPPEESSAGLWAPACISRGGLKISAGLGLAGMREERSLPLFDSFDERVGWTPYAATSQTYPLYGIWLSYGLSGEWMPAFSAGYSQVFDANYTYREQVRLKDPPDRLLGTWSMDSEGALAGPTVAIREDVLGYGSVGLSATLLSGTIEMHRSPAAQDSVVNNAEPWEAAFLADTAYSAELSGTMISLSAVATPSDRWQIGLRWTPEVNLGESLYPDLLPGRVGLGVGYLPPGFVASRVVVEFELVQWSSLADEDGAFAEMADAWEFRLGLEHRITNNMPLRLGVYHYKVPLVEPVVRTGFTLGSGAVYNNVKLDFFGGWQMSTYYHHDQFPESWLPAPYSTANREADDRIHESLILGGVTLAVEL